MAPGQQPTPTELEDLWRLRVWQARVRYERASAKYLKALELQQREQAPDPGGRQAIDEAYQEQSAARNEYMHALKILSGIINEGKLPPED